MTRFFLLILACLPAILRSQEKEWFPGGDEGFYRYLEDRLQAAGVNRPYTGRNGEAVIFEFTVTDSGKVDSVRIGTCFNVNLCIQLRLILNTMPAVQPKMTDGRPVASLRMYHVLIRSSAEGYRVEPAPVYQYSGSTSSRFKWGVVVVAIVALLIVVVK